MTTHPLDYGRPAPPRPTRRKLAKLLLAALLAAAVLSLPQVAVTQTRSRVDAVTGSMEWQTTWPLGITTGPRVDVSVLELRLTQIGAPPPRAWRFLHNTHRNLFGRALCYECGSAPPIYSFRSGLEEFVAASSDDQVREFVRVMTTSTEAEQIAAIEAAADVALGPLRTSP